ncbi:MAG: hypothetical protein ACJA01_002266, partial [Saprospiraceae bacterium]
SSLLAFGHGQKQVGCSYSYDNSKLLHLLVEFKTLNWITAIRRAIELKLNGDISN